MSSFLLDTNILSEIYRPNADEKVLRWIERQDTENLFLTVFAIGEIRIGIENLPVGKKRVALEAWVEDYVLTNFEGRILSFDTKAADVWARLTTNDRKNGRPRPTVDAMIASIALARKLTVVTRNTRDFEDLDLRVINPFEH